MKTGRNRHGRKDQWTRLRSTVLGVAIGCLALCAVPAGAQTGGAGVPLPDGSLQSSQGLVFSSPMRSAGATWYGPGLYGNGTACGQTLLPATIGVAHRTLPCGTTVKFAYRGRYLITKVIDRGPYTAGNAFDLTNGARLALGFEGVDKVRYALALGLSSRRY
jgi:Lytic transglycolase